MTAQARLDRIAEIWHNATGLGDAATSPLARAIIGECFEAADGATAPWESMSDAMDSLSRDCAEFSVLLAQERPAPTPQKVVKHELLTDDGIILAAWDSRSIPPAFSFPTEFWQVGVMVLNGLAINIVGGVELIMDGRRQWRYNVPKGAQSKLAALSPSYTYQPPLQEAE